jgi:hypothetical protein
VGHAVPDVLHLEGLLGAVGAADAVARGTVEGRVELDAPAGARDRGGHGYVGLQRRRQVGHGAVVPQHHAAGGVDALGQQGRLDPQRFRRAEDQVRQVQRVHAHVKQRAARLFGVSHPRVGRKRSRPTDVGAQGGDLADDARGDRRAEVADRRVAAHPHGLHEEHAPLAGQVDQGPRLGEVDGQRLLAQHRLARLQRPPGRLVVSIVGIGDVDDVDGVVGDQGVPVAVGVRDVEALGEGPRGFQGPRPHGRDARFGQQPEIPGEGGGDAPGGENAPSDRVSHAHHQTTPTRP